VVVSTHFIHIKVKYIKVGTGTMREAVISSDIQLLTK
jgi:hypothetical protein